MEAVSDEEESGTTAGSSKKTKIGKAMAQNEEKNEEDAFADIDWGDLKVVDELAEDEEAEPSPKRKKIGAHKRIEPPATSSHNTHTQHRRRSTATTSDRRHRHHRRRSTSSSGCSRSRSSTSADTSSRKSHRRRREHSSSTSRSRDHHTRSSGDKKKPKRSPVDYYEKKRKVQGHSGKEIEGEKPAPKGNITTGVAKKRPTGASVANKVNGSLPTAPKKVVANAKSKPVVAVETVPVKREMRTKTAVSTATITPAKVEPSTESTTTETLSKSLSMSTTTDDEHSPKKAKMIAEADTIKVKADTGDENVKKDAADVTVTLTPDTSADQDLLEELSTADESGCWLEGEETPKTPVVQVAAKEDSTDGQEAIGDTSDTAALNTSIVSVDIPLTPAVTPDAASVTKAKETQSAVVKDAGPKADGSPTKKVPTSSTQKSVQLSTTRSEVLPDIRNYCESLLRLEYKPNKYTCFYCVPCHQFVTTTELWEIHTSSTAHKRKTIRWRECRELLEASSDGDGGKSVELQKYPHTIVGLETAVEVRNDKGETTFWVCGQCSIVEKKFDDFRNHVASFAHIDCYMEWHDARNVLPPSRCSSVVEHNMRKATPTEQKQILERAKRLADKHGRGRCRLYQGPRFQEWSDSGWDMEDRLISERLELLFAEEGRIGPDYPLKYVVIPQNRCIANAEMGNMTRDVKASMIGVQYMMEVWAPSRNVTPVYFCVLCDYLVTNWKFHCTVLKHCAAYLKKHYYALYECAQLESATTDEFRQALTVARSKVVTLEGRSPDMIHLVQIQGDKNDVFVAMNANLTRHIVEVEKLVIPNPPRRTDVKRDKSKGPNDKEIPKKKPLIAIKPNRTSSRERRARESTMRTSTSRSSTLNNRNRDHESERVALLKRRARESGRSSVTADVRKHSAMTSSRAIDRRREVTSGTGSRRVPLLSTRRSLLGSGAVTNTGSRNRPTGTTSGAAESYNRRRSADRLPPDYRSSRRSLASVYSKPLLRNVAPTPASSSGGDRFRRPLLLASSDRRQPSPLVDYQHSRRALKPEPLLGPAYHQQQAPSRRGAGGDYQAKHLQTSASKYLDLSDDDFMELRSMLQSVDVGPAAATITRRDLQMVSEQLGGSVMDELIDFIHRNRRQQMLPPPPQTWEEDQMELERSPPLRQERANDEQRSEPRRKSSTRRSRRSEEQQQIATHHLRQTMLSPVGADQVVGQSSAPPMDALAVANAMLLEQRQAIAANAVLLQQTQTQAAADLRRHLDLMQAARAAVMPQPTMDTMMPVVSMAGATPTPLLPNAAAQLPPGLLPSIQNAAAELLQQAQQFGFQFPAQFR